MSSSSRFIPLEKISCFVRGALCAQTPEERVRQRLLQILCLEKGFPKALCKVEVSIDTVQKYTLPKSQVRSKRRIDVLFSQYEKEKGIFEPFFLIECKALKYDKTQINPFELASVRQLLGYKNKIGNIPFIAMASYDVIAIWALDLEKPWYLGKIEDMPNWDECISYTKNPNP